GPIDHLDGPPGDGTPGEFWRRNAMRACFHGRARAAIVATAEERAIGRSPEGFRRGGGERLPLRRDAQLPKALPCSTDDACGDRKKLEPWRICMPFDEARGGEPEGTSCKACRHPIWHGQAATRVEFANDPSGAQGLTGLYHEACARPFRSLA